MVSPTVQATLLSRRVPRRVQRAEHPPRAHRRQGCRGDHRIRRRSSTASSTNSTASSTPPASRSAPSSPAAGGTTCAGATARCCREHWSDGMTSLHGIHVHGFPNMFIVSPTQGANLISNIPHNLTEAGETIATVIAHANELAADEIEVTAEAEAAWVSQTRIRWSHVRRRPDLHAGLLQQRGQGRRREGDPQLPRLSRRTRRVLRVHRPLASHRRLRGTRIPLSPIHPGQRRSASRTEAAQRSPRGIEPVTLWHVRTSLELA